MSDSGSFGDLAVMFQRDHSLDQRRGGSLLVIDRIVDLSHSDTNFALVVKQQEADRAGDERWDSSGPDERLVIGKSNHEVSDERDRCKLKERHPHGSRKRVRRRQQLGCHEVCVFRFVGYVMAHEAVPDPSLRIGLVV